MKKSYMNGSMKRELAFAQSSWAALLDKFVWCCTQSKAISSAFFFIAYEFIKVLVRFAWVWKEIVPRLAMVSSKPAETAATPIVA